jgi:hypothetical protein
LIEPVGISELRILRPHEIIPVSMTTGVVTLDGERGFAFRKGNEVNVWLDLDGPFTIDVPRVLHVAAERGISHPLLPVVQATKKISKAFLGGFVA